MRRDTRNEIVTLLLDGREQTIIDMAEELGRDSGAVMSAVSRAWRSGIILRSKDVFFEKLRVFKGRAGLSKNVRAYHKYLLPPSPGVKEFVKDGVLYVAFAPEFRDHRAVRDKSKGTLIMEFLREYSDKAWFSTEICEALKEKGVKQRDVMHAVRRLARKDLVYVRGYKSERSPTPFRKGYLITWLDKHKPPDKAFDEAFERRIIPLLHARLTALITAPESRPSSSAISMMVCSRPSNSNVTISFRVSLLIPSHDSSNIGTN